MAPKPFNTVDVVTTFGKLILAVVNTKVFTITNIDQTIIAAPAVRVDDTFKLYFAANNRL